MTVEHKLVVGLEEIKALICACTECKARIVMLPEHANVPPKQCPRGHTWEWDIPEQYPPVSGSNYVFFLTALKRLREATHMDGFKILLEFEEPSK